MSFANVKDWFNQQKTSLQESVTRYKNKDFLEAIVAGCALVAAADGKIDASEKQKMMGFIERSDALKVFDMKDVIKRFTSYTESFDFDYTIGKAVALQAIVKLKGKDDAARLLIRVCCAIGLADGDFDDKEKASVREICGELGLNPSEFGLEMTQAKKLF